MTARMIRRKNEIIEIAEEAQEVLFDPHDAQIVDLVEDCTGYHLSEPEKRLALVAFNENAETARASIWWG